MPNHIRLSCLSVATAVVLVGCGAGTDSATASAPTPAAEHAAALTTTTPAPSAESVLTAISDIDGGGALSYDVENGSKIHYWYGLEFQVDGKRYYTGFAWFTPHKYGADRQSGRIDQAAKVTLAHATFVASNADGKSMWTLQGSESYIGEFGQAEKGNAIDTARQPQTFTTASGRLFLALPTRTGSAALAYEVLVFNPHELQGTEERKWTYLGTVPAAATASLELVSVDGSDLPALRVKATGSDNVTEYRYDSGHNTYRSISQ